ncbi:MAG: hypothetical protein QM479_05385 [Pseudomonadota bacterium]
MLSKQHIKVLLLLSHGHKIKDICLLMDISKSRIEDLQRESQGELKVETNNQAVIKALKQGYFKKIELEY